MGTLLSRCWVHLGVEKLHNGTLRLVVGTLLSRQWEPHIRLGIGTLLVCGNPVPGLCRNCTSILCVCVCGGGGGALYVVWGTLHMGGRNHFWVCHDKLTSRLPTVGLTKSDVRSS